MLCFAQRNIVEQRMKADTMSTKEKEGIVLW